ncbi:MAG TPA: DUF4129 domain-containing protein [Thermoplasmata archaeon]|nr:DUF4129 domain-containing protein [Thermoplasmata archaeon]
MARGQGYSPTLLLIGALAVVAGSAASLLGVSATGSTLISGAAGVGPSPTVAIDVILIAPVIVLIGIIGWSLLSTGGTAIGRNGAVAAIVVVAVVLLGVAWVVHNPGSLPDHVGGTLPTTGGGHGVGGGGHGSGNGTGGNNSSRGGGGGGGSNGTGGHGGSGNSTNGTGTGGGKNSSGNGTGGSGSGGGTGRTNGSGGGSHGGTGSNTSQPILTAIPPPSASSWPIFAAVAGLSLVIGALIVPRLAARSILHRRPPPSEPSRQARANAARAFSDAARRLASTSDARGVILNLYTQLMARLEPRVEIPTSRTPEEIRQSHLIPLGVRAEAAAHLTRLFEEACYSSHPIDGAAAARARESVQLAEYDLRAAHAIG